MRVRPAVCKGTAGGARAKHMHRSESPTGVQAGVLYLCGCRGLGRLLVGMLGRSGAVGGKEQGGAQVAGVCECECLWGKNQ